MQIHTRASFSCLSMTLVRFLLRAARRQAFAFQMDAFSWLAQFLAAKTATWNNRRLGSANGNAVFEVRHRDSPGGKAPRIERQVVVSTEKCRDSAITAAAYGC